MPPRILEIVLTARNLLSPELLKAAHDVAAFNSDRGGRERSRCDRSFGVGSACSSRLRSPR
jgi:hypothetical protein